MRLTTVKLSDLVQDERNARVHNGKNLEAIKASLLEFKQFRALVVQRGTNRIAAGNGVYRAMLELGWDTADVEYRDLDEKQFTRLALADNRTAELAEWDNTQLADLLKDAGDDVGVLGWSDEDISALLKAEDIVMPEIVDNSTTEDDRGTRSLPSKSQMVIAIGTLAVVYDYEKTQEIINCIVKKYKGAEDKDVESALGRFCDELYSKCASGN